MRRRPFRGGADIELLQEFTANMVAAHGHMGFLHPGDIPHRIYNGLRRDDPTELVHIWENDVGAIVGWVVLFPRGGWFDPQINPAARTSSPDLEREMTDWSELTMRRLVAEGKFEHDSISTSASENDPIRVDLLDELDWQPDPEETLVLTVRELGNVTAPQLPDGYRIRTAQGVEEAGPISELHSAGFGSKWTPEMYARVMESPGYSPDREFLVEAPDGRLAAFAVVWPDEMNRIGLFEPVAVHPEHRRLGLGKVLMRAGMVEMKQWGMTRAEVLYEESNEGSKALYLGEGFLPVERILSYRKPVGSNEGDE